MTGSLAECACVAGYSGEPCAWTGGLQGTQFANEEPWGQTNGAAILPLVEGPTGLGIASFQSSVTCNAGAVSQVVDMPSYEDAEPFVAEVTFRRENVLGVVVGYGRAFRSLRSATLDWYTDSFCLGEAAYGGPVKFQIAAEGRPAECFVAPVGSIEVDRFEILVAEPGECPAPGEVMNGQANLDEGGWRFDVEQGGNGLVQASLVPGVGESATAGARLFQSADSSRVAAMHTQLSVPLPTSKPSPALRFWWKSPATKEYIVQLGTYPGPRSVTDPLGPLFGDGSAQVTTYCLPPWTFGNVVDLTFAAAASRADFAGIDWELVVDNVEIISDARCGESTDLLDPSFDSAPNEWPGAHLVSPVEPANPVRVIHDPSRARPPGEGVLELQYSSSKSSYYAQFFVWVPPSEGDRGPQLVFHSNVPASPGVSVVWALGNSTAFQDVECVEGFCSSIPLLADLPAATGWQRNAVCLPAQWAERWFRLRVSIVPSEEPLQIFDPPRAVLLDDLTVTTDESCPTF